MNLSETWFVEGYIDFELQKYRLLGYLQEVNQYFTQTKLYPQFSDIIFHYNNLISFRENKLLLQQKFLKQAQQVDVKNLELIYKKMLEDDSVMQELEEVVRYAIDRLKSTINDGTSIYEFVENKLQLQPVGIMPIYKNEGYILLRYGQHAATRAYSYSITLFEQPDARYRKIQTTYIDSWQNSIYNTYEHIKRDIVRYYPMLPTPAVYSIESPLSVPVDETLLPIAKRMLVRYIGQ